MITRPAPGAPTSIENYVALTATQYELGSLILMVSYGAQFAFILFFLASATQLAPRYRIVPVLSAVVMLSSGLSLLREATLWQDSYSYAEGLYRPMSEGNTFSNVFRYGNWFITTPILLVQLGLAMALDRAQRHRRSTRMIAATTLMIATGMAGQFGESDDWGRLNLWGLVSTVFFVWLLVEVRGVLKIGITGSPAPLRAWPGNLFWFFLATWGLYPIAYALPQLGATGDLVVWRQFTFSVADLTTKLLYGIILSRFLLRRSALEGHGPAVEALGDGPAMAAPPTDFR
ncbi:rhodopsin [Erythrobacteraceae bacterium CFH 75059]|uniref:bacteriorhodopsin n=1 Tax=Qipengyuania thermophila TaxID=2509361 RepID=UPI00102280A7|nr:bacteriorhodopsin [Qipengyuania thermophila]TCD04109.1 rhodopsin [Erythrobacteraceae bacterium CFH 75059]